MFCAHHDGFVLVVVVAAVVGFFVLMPVRLACVVLALHVRGLVVGRVGILLLNLVSVLVVVLQLFGLVIA